MVINWLDHGTWHELILDDRSIVTKIGEKFDIIQVLTNIMVNERLDIVTLGRKKDGEKEMIVYSANLKRSFFGKPELNLREVGKI
jgi:hypothetical protein